MMEVRVKKEECSRCSIFQKHFMKANDKCAQLELDIGKKNSRIELLESTLNFVEQKKLQLEDEIRVLKQKNGDLEKSLRKGKQEEEEKFTQLQKEVRLEKMKKGIDFSEIDSENMNEANEDKDGSAGTPRMRTPSKHCTDYGLGSQRELKSRIGKHKNISPLTPGVTRPAFDPIDISDSDDNLNLSKNKKRRVTNRVTSDSESDYDDNVPISKLMSKNKAASNVDTDPGSSLNDSCSGENLKTRKRRLIKPGDREEGVSGKCFLNNSGKKSRKISESMNEIDDENEMVEDDLETESLDGFIVRDSDFSEGDSASNSDEEISENDEKSSGESQNESENSMAYNEIMSSLRREKEKLEWEYEADMLAHFDKSSELCMKAVCALYRQQIEKYKSYEDDYMPVIKGIGFNKYDASSGSELAEFLTGGNPMGNVKKSVEELEEFKPNGIELCQKLATRYSKQLFEIYKNKEDPYFRPVSYEFSSMYIRPFGDVEAN